MSNILLKKMENNINHSKWESYIPLFTALACLIMLGFMILFLYKNLFWFQENSLKQGDKSLPDEYKLSVFIIQNNIINKSSGLLAGFTIMVLGLSSSFYILKSKSKIDFETINIKATLLTASPGIVAMIVGCILSITTLVSNEQLPKYKKYSDISNFNDPEISPSDSSVINLPPRPKK